MKRHVVLSSLIPFIAYVVIRRIAYPYSRIRKASFRYDGTYVRQHDSTTVRIPVSAFGIFRFYIYAKKQGGTSFQRQMNAYFPVRSPRFRVVATCGREWLRSLIYSALRRSVTLRREWLRPRVGSPFKRGFPSPKPPLWSGGFPDRDFG